MNNQRHRWTHFLHRIYCAVIFTICSVSTVSAESFLYDAVVNNDIGKAKTLIAIGSDINFVNRYGYTLLSVAASKGETEMVELLASKGANVNLKGTNPTGYAPLHRVRNKRTVEILLSYGANINLQTNDAQTPLSLVSSGMLFGFWPKDEKDMMEIAETLVSHGADINLGAPLSNAAYANNKPMANFLIKHGADTNGIGKYSSPLNSSGANGDYVEMAQLLVENGAKVNTPSTTGWYPLMTAAGRGNIKVVNYLLAQGAEPNIADRNGFTALYSAAGSDYGVSAAEALLKRGANPNAKNVQGRTALHQAASQGALKIIELLLAYKADVNAKDNGGYTPLYGAISYGAGKGGIGIVEVLIKSGANVNVKNENEGETPLHKAISRKDIEVVKLLISHGADVNAVSRNGVKSLYFARGSKDITELLLKHGAH